MRRPLLWLTACYLGGLVAGELSFYLPLTVLLLIVAVVAIAMRHGAARRGWRAGGAIVLLVGMAVSHQWLTALLHPSLVPWLDRGAVEFTGRVVGFPQRDDDRTMVLVELLSVSSPGGSLAGERVRLNIRGGAEEVRPGDRLRVVAELRRPRGLENPGLFDSGWYARRQQIQAVASTRADRITWLAPSPTAAPSDELIDRGWRRVDRWRERIRTAMEASLSPGAAAVLSAMIVGEAQRLTPELRETFAAAGVAHLLSISGSHLAILAGVIFLLVRAVCRLLPARWLLGLTRWLMPTQVALLVALPAAAGYTLLAGGQVATVRSLLMLALYGGAVLLGRPHDLVTALAAAALVILLVDPLAIGSISFQLSYGAVLGMALVLAWWSSRHLEDDRAGGDDEKAGRQWWPRWWERAQLYLLLTVAATMITVPLVLYHFRQLNWVGLISNLVLPVIGAFVIPLGLLSALVTVAWSAATFPLASLNEWLVGWLLAVVEWFARWPGAMAHLPAPSVLTLAVIYLGLAALWWRHLRWLRRVAMGAAACWMLVTLAGLARPDDRLRVAFLDVGQGDAAVIQFPDDRVMVIDGGPRYGDYDTGRVIVSPYLWDHWRRRIDYLVATHPQADHIGGQATLLRKFSIGELWHNGVHKAGMIADQWRDAVTDSAVRTQVIRASPDPVRIGTAEVDLLHPSAEFFDRHPALTAHGENDLAIVMRLRYGQHQFLFTGDIERAAELELLRGAKDRLRATVLKVAHHGSRTSSDPAFISAVAPAYAVISVGLHNPYRHPAPNVVARYEALGVSPLRTDQDGQALFVSDGTTLTRLTAAELTLQPVALGSGLFVDELANYRRLFTRWWWRV